MQILYSYHVEVQGEIDESKFNQTSPLRIHVARADPASTLFTIYVDQSGLIGLIRHLHHQGYEILSVNRVS